METIARRKMPGQIQNKFVAIAGGGAASAKLREFGHSVSCFDVRAQIPSVTAIVKLYFHFRREQPHVVHTHGAEANFHGLIAAFLARVPVRIGEEIGIPTHQPFARFVFRQIYRLADEVIGISNSVQNWLIESKEVPPNKAIRIYNPVEIPSFTRVNPGMKSTRFRIGFVGRLEPVKNPLILVEALAQVRKLGIPAEVWMVGDGSLRAELEERAAECDISQYVSFFGYCENPEELIRQCDLYTQPSISEGFGIALVEAMGSGIPVLATPVGGAPEIIEDNVNGWLLEKPTVRCLTDSLVALWARRSHFQSIGLAGRSAVADRFTPENYVNRLGSEYVRILNSKR